MRFFLISSIFLNRRVMKNVGERLDECWRICEFLHSYLEILVVSIFQCIISNHTFIDELLGDIIREYT